MDPRATSLIVQDILFQIRLKRHLAPADVGYERALRRGYAAKLAGLGLLLNSQEPHMALIWRLD
eukprot:6877176-Prorocentrum_lima.AAC.1